MNDLLPRTTRRNRTMLIALASVSLPFVAMGTGVFDRHSHRGPLLVAVDELGTVASEATKAPNSSATSNAEPLDLTFPEMPPANLGAREMFDAEELESRSRIESRKSIHSFRQSIMNVSYPAAQSFDFDDSMRWFNGRPVRPVRTMKMLVTAYSPDERSCGESADGITASGYSVWTNGMKLAAADTAVLPFGTLISVPGYDDNAVVPVLDRGGAIKGRRLDMLCPTHEQARTWGAQNLEITVWEYADGQPNDFKARFNSASAVKN